jgi:hypothetical protein
MTRNQLLPRNVKDLSDDGVLFTVDGRGYITPTQQQSVCRGYTILTQADSSCTTMFSGHVCARQNNVCQCSALVAEVSSGNHMEIGTEYTINMSVAINSQYELYAVTGSGPIANATNGDIYVGG